MTRRDLLKAAALSGLAAGPFKLMSKTPLAPKKLDRPRYAVWTGPDSKAPAEELRKKYKTLRDRGMTGVFLSGLDKREVSVIREAGLEAHIWMWTTNRGDAWIRENHPDWYQVSRSGKSCFDNPPYVDYYRWVSPVIPGVITYLKDKVAEIATADGVSGVHLDYVRYPDVILPKALWKTYNLDQTEELPDFDFCYSEHTRKAFREKSGGDPLEIKDPAHDQEWLQFRYDTVTHLVKQLVDVAHEHKKPITAAVFPTPSMARKICRQDWDKWPLDYATPMIYHSFYEEPVEWIGEAVLEDIQAARFPIVAGLYMPAFQTPDEFKRGLAIARKRGASGVSLFGGVGDEYWRVFEAHVKG